MSVDRETLKVYEERAADYAARFDNDQPGTTLKRFLDALPEKAAILDLGCGTGASAALMQAAGHDVTCVDASPAMVEAARAKGLDAHVATFEELSGVALYDGVWANFSLLHAEEADLPRYMGKIAQALRPGGLFHVGMKVGEGMKRDGLGRRYTYVTPARLRELLSSNGITPIFEHQFSEAGLAGTEDPCIIMHGRRDG